MWPTKRCCWCDGIWHSCSPEEPLTRVIPTKRSSDLRFYRDLGVTYGRSRNVLYVVWYQIFPERFQNADHRNEGYGGFFMGECCSSVLPSDESWDDWFLLTPEEETRGFLKNRQN